MIPYMTIKQTSRSSLTTKINKWDCESEKLNLAASYSNCKSLIAQLQNKH